MRRSRYRVAAAALCWLLVSSGATSQVADLVADLEVAPANSYASSYPKGFVSRGHEAFFLARETNGQDTLWRTDGTPEGTQAVFSGATEIVAIDDDDFFFRENGKLWWTNGRTDGKAELRFLGEVGSGSGSSLQSEFTANGDALLLLLQGSAGLTSITVASKFGLEVLRTTPKLRRRGSVQGTLIYFDESGELWRSDGSEEGTFAIGRPPLPDLTTFQSLVSTSGAAYWISEVDNELQLWRTTGDTTGFERVDLSAVGVVLDLTSMQVDENSVFFLGTREVQNIWTIRDDDRLPRQATFLQTKDSLITSPTFDAKPFHVKQTDGGLYFMARDRNEDTYIWYQPQLASAARKILFFCRECFHSGDVFLHTEGNGVLFTIGNGIWFSKGSSESTKKLATCERSCEILIDDVGLLVTVRESRLDPTVLVAVDARTGALAEKARSLPFYQLSTDAVVVGNRVITEGDTFGLEPVFVDLATGTSDLLADIAGESRPPPSLLSGEAEELFFAYTSGDRGDLQLATTRGPHAGVKQLGETDLACTGGFHCIKLGNFVFDGYRSYNVESRETLWMPVYNPEWTGIVGLASGRFVYYPYRANELWSTDASVEGTTILATGVGGFQLSDGVEHAAALGRPNEWHSILITDGSHTGTRRFPVDDLEFDCQRVAMSEQWIYLGTERTLKRVARTDGQVEDLTDLLETELFRIVGAGPAVEVFLGDSRQASRHRLGDGTRTLTSSSDVSAEVADRLGRRLDKVRISEKTIISTGDFLLELGDHGEYVEHRLPVFSDLVELGGAAYFAASGLNKGVELWSVGPTTGPRLVHDVWPGPRSSDPRQLIAVGPRLFFTADDGLHGAELWALDPRGDDCQSTKHSLCIQKGRFKVDSWWKSFDGTTGRGRSVPITDDTGAFWFFHPDNLESVVKVLDGRSINRHFWSFFGSLSDVEFTLTVTDSETGKSRRYRNRSKSFASVGDTRSLNEEFDGSGQSTIDPLSVVVLPSSEKIRSADTTDCRPGPRYLCLRNGQFEISIQWVDFEGNTGMGKSRPIVDDTGSFWFFDEKNLELAIKVLDGRSVNDHYWVFFASLSNVAFTIDVRETRTGVVKRYENSLGDFASFGDVNAFRF